MIVIDASVVVDMFLGEGGLAGDELGARISRGEEIGAPHLLDAEVAQALRRLSMHGEMAIDRAHASVGEVVSLPIRRYSHGWLLRRAFELRDNATVYDALYLSLAEALDVPLLTCDARLRDVPGCHATVEVLPVMPPGAPT
ncbi:MAG: type II toxin-antitoxin system VapC family toxin [Chloroflexi bacterium]|nr:type II toxin-antitoxin system VapC family toxin [Chloroflexota bacterium]